MAGVAVVGAGVFGAWTALRLAEDGHQVTLLDAFGPANGRASSSDHSRVIRAGYGADALYSRWATESAADWAGLSAAAGQPVLTITGALFLGRPHDDYVKASYETLAALGLAAEWLDPSAIAHRFPVMAVDDLGAACYEPGGGVLHARAGVHAVVSAAVRAGVVYRTAAVAPIDEDGPRPVVTLLDGSIVAADIYVLACGPWLPTLLPQALGGRIRATRQEVLYFGAPAGDDRYGVSRLPAWIDFTAGVYGIPDLDARGFKIGIDEHGPAIDPTTADRVITPEVVARARQALARRFPGLGVAPLVEARVCQYENTSSGDFVIDRHPAWPNLWIAGGGSGHGFKHGPAVGRYVASRIAGRVAAEPRFSLASKTAEPHRAVF